MIWNRLFQNFIGSENLTDTDANQMHGERSFSKRKMLHAPTETQHWIWLAGQNWFLFWCRSPPRFSKISIKGFWLWVVNSCWAELLRCCLKVFEVIGYIDKHSLVVLVVLFSTVDAHCTRPIYLLSLLMKHSRLSVDSDAFLNHRKC